MITLPFADRDEAARALAGALAAHGSARPVVLGIPRGAVPMGRIIADALGGELDVVLVRKLGAPANPEIAIGAVDEQGSVLLNDNAAWLRIGEAYVEREARVQLARIRERRARFGGGGMAALDGRTAIVVDDGLATGSTMEAALRSVRARHPARLVCAVPVAAPESLRRIERLADEVVCLATPSPFKAVGLYYRDFASVSDEEVERALQSSCPLDGTRHHAVRIRADTVELEGDLDLPHAPLGLVLFAHGSGSSRLSPRNRFVAEALNRRGLATLLFDLLTPREDAVAANRFDLALLVRRLRAAVAWARSDARCRGLPLGLFGASTGAAAALCVAVLEHEAVSAVVSRGGRPDLAGEQMLQLVRTPVLLIVGGADREVLALNRAAAASLGAWARVEVVPGAGHLFEEPGALERVAESAAGFLAPELAAGASPGRRGGTLAATLSSRAAPATTPTPGRSW
jgi:predicted phosphoribosyltransferase/dienelactone hydrolase